MDESDVEKILSLRKHAINRMMDTLGLQPTKSNTTLEAHKRSGAVEDQGAMLDHFDGSSKTPKDNADKKKVKKSKSKNRVKSTSTSSTNKGKSRVIDLGSSDVEETDELAPSPPPNEEKGNSTGDEDDEEADGEEIDKKEVDTIFKRATATDMDLPEMEPPSSFKLQLRTYQKQALHWMHAMETGKEDARATLSLHPLFEEYAFPRHPAEIDVDEDEDSSNLSDEERKHRYFYFSPYSGSLSLDFPKASKRCKGGILADEMVCLLLFTSI